MRKTMVVLLSALAPPVVACTGDVQDGGAKDAATEDCAKLDAEAEQIQANILAQYAMDYPGRAGAPCNPPPNDNYAQQCQAYLDKQAQAAACRG
jgi:hypothetical protein